MARAEFETGMDAEVLNNEIKDVFGSVSAVRDALTPLNKAESDIFNKKFSQYIYLQRRLFF